MYNQQSFDEKKGGCGPWGRGKFGGPFGRNKFGGWTGSGFGRRWEGFHSVPVNIEETANDYVISLYAAGLVKETIKMTVKNDVLVVSYAGSEPATEGENATNYTYQEHNNPSFERSFKLNDKVLTETITASYADGILKVVLPKNPETNKPTQTITVA